MLIKYPLLHADVLVYQLDETYTENNTRNPNRTRWMRTLMREPGEDLLSLAKRVESAYLAVRYAVSSIQLHHSRTITKESMYRLPENDYSSNTLYERFKDCIRNDVDNPARGMFMELMCEEKWEVALQKYSSDQKLIQQMPDVTPEQLCQLDVCIHPPTLTDIAQELMILPVEKKGNFCLKRDGGGARLNHFSASRTDPRLILVAATEEHRGGVYRVHPRKSPDDLKWSNSLDHAVLKHPSSDVLAVEDIESGEPSEQRRRDGGPRPWMNSRARHNAARAQKYRALGRDDVDAVTKPHNGVPAGDPVFASSRHLKHQKPQKPLSHNAEPHHYDTQSE